MKLFWFLILLIPFVGKFVPNEIGAFIVSVIGCFFLFKSLFLSVNKIFYMILIFASFDLFLKQISFLPLWDFTKIIILLLSLIIFFKSKNRDNLSIFIIPIVFLLSWFFFSLEKGALSYFYPWGSFALLFSSLSHKNVDINKILKKDYIIFIGFGVTAIFLIFFKSDFEQLDYGSGRSSKNSAIGFSANQFTNFCSVFFTYFLFKYSNGFNKKSIDLFFILTFVTLFLFSLLSLSRGGILSFFIITFFFILYKFNYKKVKIFVLALFIIIPSSIYVNNLSKGSLALRFLGKSSMKKNTTLSSYDSGRTLINLGDLNSFYNNPIFGVGIGNSGDANIFININSHSEFFRFLAEHGIFGVFCLIVLIYNLLSIFPLKKENIIYILSVLLFLLILHQGSSRISYAFLFVILFKIYYQEYHFNKSLTSVK